MSNLQFRSIRSPFDDPQLASLAVAALSRADSMGLLSRRITCLEESAMEQLEMGMTEADIGRTFLAELHPLPCLEPDRLSAVLERISEALDQSPAPAQEWRVLRSLLGLDLLVRLLGISLSSARRYLSGSRPTPDAVAARLHFLALVAGDLAGAHNDMGVRRWFDRRRTQLQGATPAQLLLHSGWSPEDDGPRRVRELARTLVASPIT